MSADAHVGDAAELYAAGALSADERAAVDAHIARCTDCLRRVGEAEETVLALEAVSVVQSASPYERRVLPFLRRGVSRWWVAVAAAAALILGLMIPHRAPQSSIATLAMLHSHFAHAQFAGTGPEAKVIYARDRSWYYVIVEGNHRYEVFGMRGDESTDLGATEARNQTSELFSSILAHYDRLELRSAGKTIERAVVR